MSDDGLHPRKLHRRDLLQLRRRLDLEEDFDASEPLHVGIGRTFFDALLVQVNRRTRYEGGGPEEVRRIWAKMTSEFNIAERLDEVSHKLTKVRTGYQDENGQFVECPTFSEIPKYDSDIDAAIAFKNRVLTWQIALEISQLPTLDDEVWRVRLRNDAGLTVRQHESSSCARAIVSVVIDHLLADPDSSWAFEVF